MPETVKRKRTMRPPAATVHKEIRAESFVLVDSKGTGRARLHLASNYNKEGETPLAMCDERGKMRLTLRASEKTAVLGIFDQQWRFGAIEQLRISYWPASEGERRLGLHICDGGINEKECLSLNVDDKGGLAIITAPNGQHTSLDGDGLAIYDGATNKPLAERAAVEPLPCPLKMPAVTACLITWSTGRQLEPALRSALLRRRKRASRARVATCAWPLRATSRRWTPWPGHWPSLAPLILRTLRPTLRRVR